MTSVTCRCGSGFEFSACCEPLLGGTPAPNPERLMRSRFVAYAIGDIEYILKTTDPQRRLEVSADAVRAWMNDAEFTRLDVINAEESGTKGVVEFKAQFRGGDGVEQTHHEVSRFRKQAGVWYFHQGRVIKS